MANGASEAAAASLETNGSEPPTPGAVAEGEKSLGGSSVVAEPNGVGSLLSARDIAAPGAPGGRPNFARRCGTAASGTVALIGFFPPSDEGVLPCSSAFRAAAASAARAAGAMSSGIAVRASGSTSPPGRLGIEAPSGTGVPQTEQNFFEPMSSALHFEHVIMRTRCSHEVHVVPTP